MLMWCCGVGSSTVSAASACRWMYAVRGRLAACGRAGAEFACSSAAAAGAPLLAIIAVALVTFMHESVLSVVAVAEWCMSEYERGRICDLSSSV